MSWSSLVCSIFLLTGGCAIISPTCRTVIDVIKSQQEDIEDLKLLLEEYKLINNQEDEKLDLCNAYLDCSTCLRGNTNSSCGWCFLRNRCSLQENCPASDTNSDLWISRSDKCPKIVVVKPHYVPSHTASSLQISIQNLPDYYGIFLCSFEVAGKILFTKGEKSNDGIACPSPPINKLPPVPDGNGDLSVELSVRIPGVSIFASTHNFTIYDCDRFTSCSECADSSYPCAWCIGLNACTDDVDGKCRNDIIVFSKSFSRPTLREGPGFCPKIVPPAGSGNEIYIHAGTKQKLVVEGKNIMNFQILSTFIFQVHSIIAVTGHLLGNNLYSNEITFTGIANNPVSILPLNVFWGSGQGKLDNVHNIHVVVYHCKLLASNCGECLSLPEKFVCGWCETINQCTSGDNCGENWIDRKKTCTVPKIMSFYPKSGLSTQQTIITIKGINFGKKFEDIDRVRLINELQGLDIECVPLKEYFAKNSQIACRLEVPDNAIDVTLKGHFEVKVSKSFVTVSEEEYSFVDPIVTRFEPDRGLKSGGTFLKIHGQNLNAGSKVEVYLDHLPCNITSRHFSTIHCITAPAPTNRSTSVKVIFDGEEMSMLHNFLYMENPIIKKVYSKIRTNFPIGTISGGNLISVHGANFDNILHAYIYIRADGAEYPGECRVESFEHMLCSTPKLPLDVVRFCNIYGYADFDYGFWMEKVQVVDISFSNEYLKFRIYPDPFYMPFQDEAMTRIINSNHHQLVIYGKYLDVAFLKTDIKVDIGSENCEVLELSTSQLICKLPEVQPKSMSGDRSRLPEVVVEVEGRYTFFIGYLRYNRTLEEE